MESTPPIVSVVVPTYNRMDQLQGAIESVLNQTFSDFELIIVDDGSTDETEELVNDYSDPRIKFLSQSNRGANAARNTGIKNAKGRIISFLDSDNEYFPRRLELIVRKLQAAGNQCAGVFTGYYLFNDGAKISVSTACNQVELKDLSNENVIGGISCTAFRKNVIHEVGYLDETLSAEQDYDLYLRIANAGYYITGINRILSKSKINEDGITRDLHAKIKGQNRIMEKHSDTLSNKSISRMYYSRAFLYSKKEKGGRNSMKNFLKAIRLYPYDPLYYYHITFLLFGNTSLGKSIEYKRKLKLLVSSLRE